MLTIKGWNAHLTKPLSPETTFTSLLKCLGNVDSIHLDKRAPIDKGNNMAVDTIKFSDVNLVRIVDGIEPQKAIENLGGREDLYLKLLTGFYKAQMNMSDVLRQQFQSNDHDELYRIVHTLKSNAAYVGAFDLSVLCHVLETEIEHKNIEESTFNVMISTLDKLIENLSHTPQGVKNNIGSKQGIDELVIHLERIVLLLESSDIDVEDELPLLNQFIVHDLLKKELNTITQYIMDVEYEKANKLIKCVLAEINEC